ncbi:hypothetical protein MTO96_024703 [Rhipicephalus appendiculatus]
MNGAADKWRVSGAASSRGSQRRSGPATPVDASSSQPGPLGLVSSGVATVPPVPSAPWRPGSGYSEVPKFSGYDDRQTPDKFLQRLEEFCAISGVTDEQRLRQVIPAASEGSAKLWLRFAGPFDAWAVFLEQFQAEFVSVDYKQRLKAEMQQRTQHPHENMRHFIQ